MTRLSPQADEAPPPGCFAGVEFARGRLFDTTDLDEAREICGRVFNPHCLSLVGPASRCARAWTTCLSGRCR
jgi:hypothetical protein